MGRQLMAMARGWITDVERRRGRLSGGRRLCARRPTGSFCGGTTQLFALICSWCERRPRRLVVASAPPVPISIRTIVAPAPIPASPQSKPPPGTTVRTTVAGVPSPGSLRSRHPHTARGSRASWSLRLGSRCCCWRGPPNAVAGRGEASRRIHPASRNAGWPIRSSRLRRSTPPSTVQGWRWRLSLFARRGWGGPLCLIGCWRRSSLRPSRAVPGRPRRRARGLR
jgi:hypothetical protein